MIFERLLAALLFLDIDVTAEETLPEPPTQPLPFSHKTHADADMACQTYHPNPDPGKNMGIARPLAWMSCHKAVKVTSPAIRQLRRIGTFAGRESIGYRSSSISTAVCTSKLETHATNVM